MPLRGVGRTLSLRGLMNSPGPAVVQRLRRLRVVLVDPGEPGNVGSSARAMANMGLRRLVLVPRRVGAERLLGGEARRLACGGAEILEGARAARDLPTALEGTSFAVAATARPRARLPVRGLEDLPGVLLPLLARGEEAALVFGPEDRGLSNQELDLCQSVVTVPTDPEHSSLNLAQAVLVFCYEIGRAVRRDAAPAGPGPSDPAPAEEREAMYRQMEEVLLRIGYLNPVAPHHILGDLRRVVDRARPTSREISLLRGIWSQMDWAVGDPRPSEGRGGREEE